MTYSELNYEIHSQLERLGWSAYETREHLTIHYGKGALSLLTNEQLNEFLQFLKSRPVRLMTPPTPQVSIPTGLFDQIERYLEYRASNADGEASRLLMALEDLEIDRTAKQEVLTKQE